MAEVEAIGEGMSDDGSWARDELLMALRKHAPDEVPKAELQEIAGMGTNDMRDAIENLREVGMLQVTATGYVLTDQSAEPGANVEPVQGALGELLGQDLTADVPVGEEEPGEYGLVEDEDDDDPEEEPEEPAVVAAAPGSVVENLRFQQTIAIEIGYIPVGQPGETVEAIAEREGQEIAAEVRRFVEGRWKGVSVGTYVAGTEVFQQVGRIS